MRADWRPPHVGPANERRAARKGPDAMVESNVDLETGRETETAEEIVTHVKIEYCPS